MNKLIQQQKEHIQALEVQIAENKKILDNPKAKLTVYFRANQKEKELKKQLEEVEGSLRQLLA